MMATPSMKTYLTESTIILILATQYIHTITELYIATSYFDWYNKKLYIAILTR